jgi:hypothetical protein
MPTSKMPCCLGQTLSDLLEHAKAVRQRAARIREEATELNLMSDRLQAREGAMALDRQAAVLEVRAAQQIAALSRS